MSKISFTSGTISPLFGNYYTLTLFNNDKAVYKATIDQKTGLSYTAKHKTIQFLHTSFNL